MHSQNEGNITATDNEVILSNVELEDMKTDLNEQLNGDEVFENEEDKENSKRQLMKRCMKSRRLHVIVVILVILDSICVSVELIVDLIVTVYNQHRGETSVNSTLAAILPAFSNRSNHTSLVQISEYSSSLQSYSNNHIGHYHDHYQQQKTSQTSHRTPSSTQFTHQYLWSIISDMNFNYLTILISIETFFKYFGLMILSLFVVEITCKIIFIPRELVRSKWGIFDAIVVFTSFIIDIILLKDRKILHTVSGLITLFRQGQLILIIKPY